MHGKQHLGSICAWDLSGGLGTYLQLIMYQMPFSPRQSIRMLRCGPIDKTGLEDLNKVEKGGLPKPANPATKPCMENAIWGQLVPRTSLEAFVHTYS